MMQASIGFASATDGDESTHRRGYLADWGLTNLTDDKFRRVQEACAWDAWVLGHRLGVGRGDTVAMVEIYGYLKRAAELGAGRRVLLDNWRTWPKGKSLTRTARKAKPRLNNRD